MDVDLVELVAGIRRVFPKARVKLVSEMRMCGYNEIEVSLDSDGYTHHVRAQPHPHIGPDIVTKLARQLYGR